MVAVRNYHGTPAPPGKPPLALQTGDFIELLKGEPETSWWEVRGNTTRPPKDPTPIAITPPLQLADFTQKEHWLGYSTPSQKESSPSIVAFDKV